MCKIKNFFFSFILLANTAIAAPLGNTVFTITPSITNIYLSSHGAGNVMYTVTNNATIGVTPSLIDPGYQSSGTNLKISSNTCISSLSPGASCTFRVLISGANQPSTFTITPRVCGFNDFLCSVAGSAVTVTVTKPAAGLPPRAYEEVAGSALISNTKLVGININNTSDRIFYSLGSNNSINGVVISPDGSKVYATYGDSVYIFNVEPDGLLLYQSVVVLPPGFQRTVPLYNMQMAITPDGTALFISIYGAVGLQNTKNIAPGSGVFLRMNLVSNANTVTRIADPENVLTDPRGLVVSPDSKTVYVGTNTNYIVAMPVSAASIDFANKLGEEAIPEDEHLGLAMDPAGNKLYVGNYLAGSVSVLMVDGMRVQSVNTILDTGDYTGASGLAVSPDGARLYVAEHLADSVLAVSLNNLALSVLLHIQSAFGLGLSLDGATLYVTQFGDGINTTTAIETADFSATPIDIGGVSSTIGQFIGP